MVMVVFLWVFILMKVKLWFVWKWDLIIKLKFWKSGIKLFWVVYGVKLFM